MKCGNMPKWNASLDLSMLVDSSYSSRKARLDGITKVGGEPPPTFICSHSTKPPLLMICIRDERLRYQTYSPSWVFGLEVQTMKTVMPSMLRCDDETWVVNRPKSSPRWDASISTHPYGACTRWKRDAWAMSVWVWVLRIHHDQVWKRLERMRRYEPQRMPSYPFVPRPREGCGWVGRWRLFGCWLVCFGWLKRFCLAGLPTSSVLSQPQRSIFQRQPGRRFGMTLKATCVPALVTYLGARAPVLPTKAIVTFRCSLWVSKTQFNWTLMSVVISLLVSLLAWNHMRYDLYPVLGVQDSHYAVNL